MIFSSKAITHTLAGGSIACALLLVGMYGTHVPVKETTAEAAAVIHSLSSVDIRLTAKAAIVYDPTTKRVLFAKEADTRLPLASLTKLMAAEAVLASAPENTWVTITKESIKPEGDWGFAVGEQWSLVDLVRFGLVASSNDAIAAAAQALGSSAIDLMNNRASELGLSDMYFFNPTGLDVDGETAGAYGSAHDMAILAATFLEEHPALFEATVSPAVTITSGTRTLTATPTAEPLREIPGLIGAKTGYTDLAGGNLVAAVDIRLGRPLIIAVLGSTREGRFADVKALVAAARELITTQP